MTAGRRELPVAGRLGAFAAILAVAFAAAYGVGVVAGPAGARPAAAGTGEAGAGEAGAGPAGAADGSPTGDAGTAGESGSHGGGAGSADGGHTDGAGSAVGSGSADGAGSAVGSGSADGSGSAGGAGSHDGGAGPAGGGHGEGAAGAEGAAELPGLAVSRDGYTLVPESVTLPAGAATPFRFTVTGPDGRPVTRYQREHEKDLHLVVVRRDLAAYQHLHPTLGADGRWSARLDLAAAGTYRVFADFVPAGGPDLTLGVDVAVAGTYRPAALPAPAATATVAGYQVSLAGTPVAGRETGLTFTVRRGGAPVTVLQPYLGAYGHLVSLRVGDLAYLHTHPAQEAAAGRAGGPEVRFGTTFPTAGTYRLFLDFQVGGVVRTAALTVSVAG